MNRASLKASPVKHAMQEPISHSPSSPPRQLPEKSITHHHSESSDLSSWSQYFSQRLRSCSIYFLFILLMLSVLFCIHLSSILFFPSLSPVIVASSYEFTNSSSPSQLSLTPNDYDMFCRLFHQTELCYRSPHRAGSRQSPHRMLCQHCQAKLSTSNNTSSASSASSLPHSHDDSSSFVDLSMLLSPHLPQCSVGYSRIDHSANILRHHEDRCVNRGYDDRNNLFSRWTGLPLQFIHSAIDLLDHIFANSSYVDLIFLGDSVSSQLSQFLICDLIRLGIPLSPSQSSRIESFTHTTTEFSFPFSLLDHYRLNHRNKSSSPSPSPSTTTTPSSSMRKILRIHNKQFNLPCMNLSHSECQDFSLSSSSSSVSSFAVDVIRNRGIHLISNYMNRLINLFVNITTLDHNNNNNNNNNFNLSDEEGERDSLKSSRDIILIVNYGLHIKQIHRPWAIPGMMKGILEEAKRGALKQSYTSSRVKNIRILFRETSSQAFGYSRDGYYHWDKGRAHFEGYCCQRPNKHDTLNNWKTQDVLTELHTLDSKWRHYLGWIPFFDSSIELSDIRIEYDDLHNVPDCTHFIYTPFAYEKLWWELQGALSEISH